MVIPECPPASQRFRQSNGRNGTLFETGKQRRPADGRPRQAATRQVTQTGRRRNSNLGYFPLAEIVVGWLLLIPVSLDDLSECFVCAWKCGGE